MDQQKAFGRITKRVHIEKAVVRRFSRARSSSRSLTRSSRRFSSTKQLTYRLAARELGVSVKDAKACVYHSYGRAQDR